jgi:uncharacterized protein YdeI (YjbR/CyaY-like superfamily)
VARLDSLELLELPDREAWSRWLEANHGRSDGVWLAVGKKGNTRTSLMYEDAVQEALRFGWIDSTVRRLDADRSQQLYTPRRPGGTWALSNKRRVERLMADGLMEPAGMAAIERAKADGSWMLLDDVENLVVPADLAVAFETTPAAAESFGGLPESKRKLILYWIGSTKREATRQARIAKAVEALAAGESPV